ncbi:PhoD-like phosphatase-domain-containing protein [Hysterangium stoloniferum]|nr:PhoD-like phosphatase-domain-containing protein [Hysterangium stoloniferum]
MGNPFNQNLVYRSPFEDHPQFDIDTEEIHERHARAFAKRQTESASQFADDHYPTFFGSDFSNAPFVWNAGVNFTHKVASGDPTSNSVLLWTRALPLASTIASNPSSTPFLPDQSVPVCVRYEIATDQALTKVVNTGTAFTSADVDFTVKLEATGLKPDTVYFYQFSDCTNKAIISPVGRTRTFADDNTPASKVNGGKPLTFAVFSCSQFQAGYFNAYNFAATNVTPDAFIHLGDYIYESLGDGAPIGRAVLGRELATIQDYRQRFNQYRTDIGLVNAHLSGPWINVWDDHEVADNSWKAGTTDSNDTAAGCTFSPSGACFTDRKLAAVRAYHEWLPIRQVIADDKLRIWRNFQIGKLLDLTMLDTRQYDRDVTDVGYNTVVNTIADFPGRSIMGLAQENWFYSTLSQSKARGAIWRVVGQQVVFTQVNFAGFFDLDAWDGYRQNRNRVLNHLFSNKIDNTVILSGDSHANWVSDLAHPNDTTTYNSTTGQGAIGVEFAGTAVTSGSAFGTGITPAAADKISDLLVHTKGNEDLQWSEGSFRGFFTLTITPKTLTATYYGMRDVSNPNLDGMVTAKFVVNAGENRLSRPVAGGSVVAGVLKSSP